MALSSKSIWNLPIGDGAKYVPAKIKIATEWGMTIDPDVILLTPSAPNTDVYYCKAGWNHGNRCEVDGGVLFSGPIPRNFTVANDGNNYSTAILLPDGNTIVQGQPLCRCEVGGSVTSLYKAPSVTLDGDGQLGAHGGSGLSSMGGTLRMGELVPGGQPIRHALKVNLDAKYNFYKYPDCKRWPAVFCDGYAETVYNGTNPSLRMGSLLALDPSKDINNMGFETEPAKMLAWTFQNYGSYTVDDTFWYVYAIETELNPFGDVATEFRARWGFPINPQTRDTPWARDMDRLFLALSVVDNWDENMYKEVAASDGNAGSGGGKPRQPWAPPLK